MTLLCIFANKGSASFSVSKLLYEYFITSVNDFTICLFSESFVQLVNAMFALRTFRLHW